MMLDGLKIGLKWSTQNSKLLDDIEGKVIILLVSDI